MHIEYVISHSLTTTRWVWNHFSLVSHPASPLAFFLPLPPFLLQMLALTLWFVISAQRRLCWSGTLWEGLALSWLLASVICPRQPPRAPRKGGHGGLIAMGWALPPTFNSLLAYLSTIQLFKRMSVFFLGEPSAWICGSPTWQPRSLHTEANPVTMSLFCFLVNTVPVCSSPTWQPRSADI